MKTKPATSLYSGDIVRKVAAELVINGSIELSIRAGVAIPEAADLLPFGMAVYVPKLLKRSLTDNLPVIRALHRDGFDPVPHIAARQVLSEQALDEFLERAVENSGVHRVMLVGGDDAQVKGPFPDGASLLKSGILSRAGIREVDVAGYPEGHPRIPSTVLAKDLEEKLGVADKQGLGLNIVTQFSFVPARIVEYCNELTHIAPHVPIYVGMAGPTDSASLFRFARHCGVSEAIRALTQLGVKAAKLASHTNPDEQVEVLARYCAGREACNVIGIHVFSFGGFTESAQWMHGRFPNAPAPVE